MISEEKELVSLLKEGDEKAYEILYAKHYSALCSFSDSIVRDSFAAEEIVNEVIFHIWQNRKALTISTSLRFYLTASVRNKSLDYLNLNRVKNRASFDDIPNFARGLELSEQPIGKLISRELETVISKAIEHLPDETKAVFKKSRFEDKNYIQIADELGISVNTVKYHIKRALALLSKTLSNSI